MPVRELGNTQGWEMLGVTQPSRNLLLGTLYRNIYSEHASHMFTSRAVHDVYLYNIILYIYMYTHIFYIHLVYNMYVIYIYIYIDMQRKNYIYVLYMHMCFFFKLCALCPRLIPLQA